MPHADAKGTQGSGRVLAMESFRRMVVDLDRAIEFYCDALGFELDIVVPLERERGRRAVLTLGSDVLELISKQAGPAILGGTRGGSSDLGFQHIAVVASDMEAACERLQRFLPEWISSEAVVTLPPSTGSISAFKFRDPDGHPLELLHFPEGSGDEKWHRAVVGAPTIGIDHSAIVVGEVSRSIDFYRAVLGFSVSAKQVNRGAAQDALDGVNGVILDVVALATSASRTPHLELLGYRVPVPGGTRRDVARAWGADQVVWAVEGLADILSRLNQTSCSLDGLSSSGASFGEVVVFDPDGHQHCLIERDAGEVDSFVPAS